MSEEYLILKTRRKGLLLRKLRFLNSSSFFLLADTLASNQPRANLGEQLEPTGSSAILSDDSDDVTDAESDASPTTPTSPLSVTTTPTLTQSSNIDIDDDNDDNNGTSSRNLPSYEAKINGNDDVTGTPEVETR